MIKRSITVLLILIAFFSLLFLSMPKKIRGADSSLYAVKGKMDLSKWDMEEPEILRLNGEWEFYWNQLLTPTDFQSSHQPSVSGYMQVPGLWNGKTILGKKLPVFGCATYRLVLNHVSANEVLGLKRENARFSSKVFVNGEELISDGLPALNSKDYRSGNTPRLSWQTMQNRLVINCLNYVLPKPMQMLQQ